MDYIIGNCGRFAHCHGRSAEEDRRQTTENKVMCRLDDIRRRRADVHGIAKRHNAIGIFVFGSCARREDDDASDIDFLVDFNPKATLFDQIGIRFELEDMFGCKVDVVSRRGLAPELSKTIQTEAVEI